MKEAIDIMHVITIYLDEMYTSKVIEREVQTLIDMFNSVSDNYTAIYLSDPRESKLTGTIRISLDVRGIIEYTDRAANYVDKLYTLSSMYTLEREDIESEVHKFHDITKLEFGRDDFFISNIGFGSSSKPLKEYE